MKQRLPFCIFRQNPAEISRHSSLVLWAPCWEFVSPRGLVLIAVLCLPLPVKVNNCDSGYSCSSPTWTPFMWGTRSCFEAWEMETVGRWEKVNWLGRYFCWLEPSLSVTIISVISSSAMNFCCIPGQTHAPTMSGCVYVCRPPTLSHTLPITLPDWIYANWTKIKSHLQGDLSWDSFVHTLTHHTVWFLQL